jgi:hypothetical protein
MKVALFLHPFMTRSVIGMKLDTRIKRNGICRAIRLTVVMLGVTGLVPAAASADEISGLADPTRPAYSVDAPAGSAPAKPTGPLLQSTFISTSQRRAVISGKTYTVGERFGGAVITDIQPYEVVLKQAGRETHLRLLPKLAKETYVVKVPANSQEGGQ